jgi:hypothetical protein
MTILKGIERCQFISDMLDESHYLIWAKDMSNNLIFVNKPAFDLFKKLSMNGSLVCPIEIKENSVDKEAHITIDDVDIWLGYSSTVITNEGSNFILILAKDITDKKKDMMDLSETLDRKISEWNEEKRERLQKIDKRDKEMIEVLNLTSKTY